MFDFSLGKLILLALIALLVLGPDKLPGAARTVGALIRRLRSGWDNVRAEVERELEIEEIRRAARQAAADAEATQAQASETLRQLQTEMEKARAQARELTDTHDGDADSRSAIPDRAASAADALARDSNHGQL
ncbi:MAG TPA: Sec-independent protein translocase protein TatB [Rhodanobacteraceae bacterium]|nr:Sec-independent protein translocase protein TatB [Rhodanobacteraceae bacterium]